MSGKVSKKYRREKIEKAITMVNDVVKLRIASSAIHGVGVFAIRDIRKGERVYANAMPNMLDIPYKKFKKINKEVQEVILERFPRVIEGSHFMCPDTLMQIYMNHADIPNYSGASDKAMKRIKKGEEVTEDYRQIKGWQTVYSWLI